MLSPALLSLVFLASPPIKTPSPLGWRAEPTAAVEAKKLHVLLIFDTGSTEGAQLEIDKKRVLTTLAGGIPADRYTTIILDGKKVTRENILASAQKLATGPDDSILLYYGGKGSSQAKAGDVLVLPAGGKLALSDLQNALEAKNPRFLCLVADFTGTTIRLTKKTSDSERRETTVLQPTLRSLFFLSRGKISITVPGGKVGAGDEDAGGIFNRVFCRLLQTPGDVKRDSDGLINWTEFFPHLQRQTATAAKDWVERFSRSGTEVSPDLVRPKAVLQVNRPLLGKPFAVITLANKTDQPIRLAYRWEALSDWKSLSIEPGEAKHLFAPIRDLNAMLPRCEIQREGADKIKWIDPGKWCGEGDPPLTAGRSYHFRKPK